MPINTPNELFMHELGDIYDAEHQFFKGQQEMLQNATSPTLQQMITTHIEQTRLHIQNLEKVFNLAGMQPQRKMCDAAKGLVSEAQKGLKETAGAPSVRDCAIAGAASRVEHYEMAVYRGLITAAQLMGQQEIVGLLKQNLMQEEQTANLIEQNFPTLLQTAMSKGGA